MLSTHWSSVYMASHQTILRDKRAWEQTQTKWLHTFQLQHLETDSVWVSCPLCPTWQSSYPTLVFEGLVPGLVQDQGQVLNGTAVLVLRNWNQNSSGPQNFEKMNRLVLDWTRPDRTFWVQVDAPISPIFLATFTKFFKILTILLDFIPYILCWSLWKWHVMRKCSYLLILWAKSLDQSVIGKLRMAATTWLTKSKSDFYTITLKKAPISKDWSKLVLVQSFWFWKVLQPVLDWSCQKRQKDQTRPDF